MNFYRVHHDFMLWWTEKPASTTAGKESAHSRRAGAREFSVSQDNRQTDVIFKRQIMPTAQQPGSSFRRQLGCLVQQSSETNKFWWNLKQDANSSDKGLWLFCFSEVWFQILQLQSVKSNSQEAQTNRDKMFEFCK